MGPRIQCRHDSSPWGGARAARHRMECSFRGDALRPADLSGIARSTLRTPRRFAFGKLPTLKATTGSHLGVQHSAIAFALVGAVLAVGCMVGVRALLFAVGKKEEAARYSGIRTEADHDRRIVIAVATASPRSSSPLYAVDFDRLAGNFTSFTRSRRRCRRLFAARRRGSGCVVRADLLRCARTWSPARIPSAEFAVMAGSSSRRAPDQQLMPTASVQHARRPSTNHPSGHRLRGIFAWSRASAGRVPSKQPRLRG